MRTSPLFSILEQALPEIERIGKSRLPNEACGLLLDMPWHNARGQVSYVKELPNRSLTADRYQVNADDIRYVLEGLEEVEDVAVWHTHPSGFLGPSEGDLEHRPDPNIWMLVVALTDDGPVATWF